MLSYSLHDPAFILVFRNPVRKLLSAGPVRPHDTTDFRFLCIIDIVKLIAAAITVIR